MHVEEQLKIISQAWGRRQKGYCFFPYINGKAKNKDERIASYREGPAFFWPKDKERIIAHLTSHRADDVYWCPSLFETRTRRLEFAMDEHALWADLDGVDPADIKDYPPTVAWETSPGRYQALWVLSQGDVQGASWPGRENQCLTYHLGADASGWDTTQLLRVPGWRNHKPEYRKKYKKAPLGKLLWSKGRYYLADDFNELPDVPGGTVTTDFVEDTLDHIDRHEVWGRVRLKVSKRVRGLMVAREAAGDRSETLWEIERDLADAGCSLAEIIKLIQPTPWNKYAGRTDELRRLQTEVSKALYERPTEVVDRLEEEMNRPKPQRLFAMLHNLPAPKWLVKDILTEGAVGFIAGQPKSFKTWFGFDLALSVSSGQPFLGQFSVLTPGPVLYIQEEDSPHLVAQRLKKIWPAKHADKVTMESGVPVWIPPSEVVDNPPIDGYIMEGLTLSDESWQAWLDDTMAEGGYKLLIIDPLMMTAGDVEENRAQEMVTKIFRPLKELARKHHCAIQLVHHLRKGGITNGNVERGGQLLLGSVANHAWAEDSMFLRRDKAGGIIVEQESKYAPVPGFRVSHLRNKEWEPIVTVHKSEVDDEYIRVVDEPSTNGHNSHAITDNKCLKALGTLSYGYHFTYTIADAAGIKTNSATRQLNRLQTMGLVERTEVAVGPKKTRTHKWKLT